MNTQNTINLSDFSPINKDQNRRRQPLITAFEALLRLNQSAHTSMGSPSHVEVLINEQGRMFLIRGTDGTNANGYKVSAVNTFGCRALCRLLRPENVTSVRVPLSIVDGALVGSFDDVE